MSGRDGCDRHLPAAARYGTPERGEGDDGMEWATRVFLKERTLLLRTAHRIVKDYANAEDVVQDVWLRWQRVDRSAVRNPGAFLMTATTHLAINFVQSARHRHEEPTDLRKGPRLERTGQPDLEVQAARAVANEQVLGLLMAKLTAPELAAYLLRKSFDYPYSTIAESLGMSVDSARQLVRRGQLALRNPRTRPVDRTAHRRLIEAFSAATNGQLGELERLLIDVVNNGRTPHRSRSCATPRANGNGRVAAAV